MFSTTAVIERSYYSSLLDRFHNRIKNLPTRKGPAFQSPINFIVECELALVPRYATTHALVTYHKN